MNKFILSVIVIGMLAGNSNASDCDLDIYLLEKRISELEATVNANSYGSVNLYRGAGAPLTVEELEKEISILNSSITYWTSMRNKALQEQKETPRKFKLQSDIALAETYIGLHTRSRDLYVKSLDRAKNRKKHIENKSLVDPEYKK